MTKLGNWIRDQLKEGDRTREDLAKAMGISPATLDGIIGGEIERPPDARLSALARFFGVSAETVRRLIPGGDLDVGGDIRQGGQPGEGAASASFRLRTDVLFMPAPVFTGEQGKSQRVLLVPDGRTTLRDGTRILADREGAETAIKALKDHGADLPFDKNHSTVLKLPKGEDAPAFGWIKSLLYEPGVGICCDVEWTDEGHEEIRKGRYRYVSPVIGYEKETGRVRHIYSAALTTVPATPNMPALAATFNPFQKEDESMMGLIKKLLQEDGAAVATAEQKVGELKALLETMGVELGDGADFVSILNAAMAKLKGDGGEKKEPDAAATEEADVAASVRVKLGLAADADKETVVKALSDLRGHVGYVPAGEHSKLLSRVGALEDEAAGRNADDLVQKYLTQGKLMTNDSEQMKWALDRAKNAPRDFEQIMAHAPVVVPVGRTSAPPPPSGAAGGQEDKLIEKALSDHDGNHKNAMVALQTKLMSDQEARGLNKRAARERCEADYPKIFG